MRDLTPDVRDALVNYLYALADDELLVGHRASEWTGLAPILEADVALSSIAQDEMGHALTFYQLLEALGEGNPDDLAFARGVTDFRNAIFSELPRGDWAFTVVRQYLHDVAERVRLEALANSAYEPLAHVARKLIVEEKYHLLHDRSWVAKLGGATEESHRRMQAALDRAFPHALGLFEPADGEAVRAEAGIAPPERELRDRWLDEVVPFLESATLRVPARRDDRGEWQVLVEPVYGGRRGRHTEYLETLLDAMQMVYRMEPGAKW